MSISIQPEANSFLIRVFFVLLHRFLRTKKNDTSQKNQDCKYFKGY